MASVAHRPFKIRYFSFAIEFSLRSPEFHISGYFCKKAVGAFLAVFLVAMPELPNVILPCKKNKIKFIAYFE